MHNTWTGLHKNLQTLLVALTAVTVAGLFAVLSMDIQHPITVTEALDATRTTPTAATSVGALKVGVIGDSTAISFGKALASDPEFAVTLRAGLGCSFVAEGWKIKDKDPSELGEAQGWDDIDFKCSEWKQEYDSLRASNDVVIVHLGPSMIWQVTSPDKQCKGDIRTSCVYEMFSEQRSYMNGSIFVTWPVNEAKDSTGKPIFSAEAQSKANTLSSCVLDIEAWENSQPSSGKLERRPDQEHYWPEAASTQVAFFKDKIKAGCYAEGEPGKNSLGYSSTVR